jgi:WD40 repeat protein
MSSKQRVPVKTSRKLWFLFSALAFFGVGACGFGVLVLAYFLLMHTFLGVPDENLVRDLAAAQLGKPQEPPVKKIDDQVAPLREYSNPYLGVKLQMPGAPVEDQWDYPNNRFLQVFRFARKGENFVFLSGNLKTESTRKDIVSFVENFRDMLLDKAKCKLSKQTDAKDNSNPPGIRFEGTAIAGNGNAIRGKIFFAPVPLIPDKEPKGNPNPFRPPTKGLVTAVFGEATFVHSPEATQFLESFSLIPATHQFDRPTVAGGHRIEVAMEQPGGHGSLSIKAVAFSPDDRWLILGCRQSARIWDLAVGRQVRILKGHREDVQAVVFSHDGRWVLTVGGGEAKLWDFASGKEIRTFKANNYGGSTAIFSSDGEWVVTATDKTATIYERETGKPVRTFEGVSPIRALALSKDKKKLVASQGSVVAIWELLDGNRRYTLPNDRKEIHSLALSADERQLVTHGFHQEFAELQWSDLASGQTVRSIGSQFTKYCVPSSDRKHVLVGGGRAALFDIADGTAFRSFWGWSSRGQLGIMNLSCAGLSNDGKRVVGGDELSAHVWDAATGWPLCRLTCDGDGSWAVFDADGRCDYDRNPSGVGWSHPTNPLKLSGLGNQFRDQGLLAKYMGFNHQPLRDLEK